jgi:tetratricopeptide (TPR) repeat protein
VNIKRWVLGAFCLFAAGALKADVLPFDVTVYGLYGAPTRPDSLAHSNYDGLGFGGSFEWNPSYFASLGLSYEQTNFYGSPNFSAGTLNLEGKFFVAAFIRDMSPYFSAGAGINMFTPKTGWPGSLGLKIGLGDKVPFIGPTLLDIGFNYHWMTDPGAFQYADLHMGVGFAFDITPPPAEASASTQPEATPVSKPKSTPLAAQVTASPVVTATVTATSTPGMMVETATATATVTSTATPSTPTITPTPEPTLTAVQAKAVISKMKKYYHLGVTAFRAHNYKASMANFNVCVGIHESVVPSFYYAEAYSTLGVIYEFHKTTKGHLDMARKYYQMALDIDPQTATAKKYLAKLGPAVKAKPKAKVKKHKAAVSATPVATASTPEVTSSMVTPSAAKASDDFSFEPVPTKVKSVVAPKPTASAASSSASAAAAPALTPVSNTASSTPVSGQ